MRIELRRYVVLWDTGAAFGAWEFSSHRQAYRVTEAFRCGVKWRIIRASTNGWDFTVRQSIP